MTDTDPTPPAEAALICAWCAREYPADENYHEPFCSQECDEADAESRAGDDDDA